MDKKTINKEAPSGPCQAGSEAEPGSINSFSRFMLAKMTKRNAPFEPEVAIKDPRDKAPAELINAAAIKDPCEPEVMKAPSGPGSECEKKMKTFFGMLAEMEKKKNAPFEPEVAIKDPRDKAPAELINAAAIKDPCEPEVVKAPSGPGSDYESEKNMKTLCSSMLEQMKKKKGPFEPEVAIKDLCEPGSECEKKMKTFFGMLAEMEEKKNAPFEPEVAIKDPREPKVIQTPTEAAPVHDEIKGTEAGKGGIKD